MSSRSGSNEVQLHCTNPECGEQFSVQVEWYYDTGRIYGPPENCYPPEAGYEIVGEDTYRCEYCGQVMTVEDLDKELENWWATFEPEEQYDEGPYDTLEEQEMDRLN